MSTSANTTEQCGYCNGSKTVITATTLPQPKEFTEQDMEGCFVEGIKAGKSFDELPTPRIMFKDFIQSLKK